jgi:3'(2'), 5'-bisphosphate nucleotidase
MIIQEPNRDHLSHALEASLLAGERIMEIYYSDEYHMEMKEDRSPVTDADHAAHAVITECLGRTALPVLSEEGREIPFGDRKGWKDFWMVDPLDGTKEFIRGNGEFTVNIALIEDVSPVLGVIYCPFADLVYFSDQDSGPFRCKGFAGKWKECSSAGELREQSESLPVPGSDQSFRIVASRSHLSPATRKFIRSLRKKHRRIETVSKGSALKFGLLAEGSADIYPRFGPTWEWDTAAGQAIAEASGCRVTVAGSGERLLYNKKSLLNPHFIVERMDPQGRVPGL